jgi:hypothetical protein
VKFLRICLLVLLAALLPVRGAWAAAMVCAPAAGAMSGAAMAHADCADGQAGSDQAHSDKMDKCNLCSSSCSATPLLHDVPRIAEPFDQTSASYPEVPAAAPSFLSDGQERPPRSI